MKTCVLVVVVGVAASSAMAGETLRLVDTTLSGVFSGPYVFANGGGNGFGGTLGQGSFAMDSDLSNLYLTFTAGNALNDNVIVMLDTREGGFTDPEMRDRADGGRFGASELSRDDNDGFDPNFLPDFAIVIGNFGTVLFELTAGDTDGHLNFLDFSNNTNVPVRDYGIPLASIGVVPGGEIKFFAAYTSNDGFLSNESLPANDFNNSDNPGYGNQGRSVSGGRFGNYNVFETVPTPGSVALMGLAGLCGLRRRRA